MATIDLTDLERGEGEWRNMQEVIRRTFRSTLKQVERQQEQINQLVTVTTNLREIISTKMTSQEVEHMISNRERAYSQNKHKDEIEATRSELVNIKMDLERKANMRYVDESLKRKVDKTDLIVRSAMTGGAPVGPQNTSEIGKLFEVNGHLRARMEILETIVSSFKEDLKSAAKESEIRGLKYQVDQVFDLIKYSAKKEEISNIVEKKVDRPELEILLNTKAEKSNVVAAITQLESVLADHEKRIEAMRLHMSDGGNEIGNISFYSNFPSQRTSR